MTNTIARIETTATVPAAEFAAALDQVSRAMPADPRDWYLNGVRFEFRGGHLLLATGDGHRSCDVLLQLEKSTLRGVYVVKSCSVKEAVGALQHMKNDLPTAHVKFTSWLERVGTNYEWRLLLIVGGRTLGLGLHLAVGERALVRETKPPAPSAT